MTARSRRFKFIAKRADSSSATSPSNVSLAGLLTRDTRLASSLASVRYTRTISIKRHEIVGRFPFIERGPGQKYFSEHRPQSASATRLFLTSLCVAQNERFFRSANGTGRPAASPSHFEVLPFFRKQTSFLQVERAHHGTRMYYACVRVRIYGPRSNGLHMVVVSVFQSHAASYKQTYVDGLSVWNAVRCTRGFKTWKRCKRSAPHKESESFSYRVKRCAERLPFPFAKFIFQNS